MSHLFQIHHGRMYAKACVIGIFSGLIVTAYRFALNFVSSYTPRIAALLHGNGIYAVLVFIALIVAGCVIGALVQLFPLIRGSGIPQVKGALEEMGQPVLHDTKVFRFRPIRELIAKFVGGVVALAAGLSLGREGPSIHLGAYTALAVSNVFRKKKQVEGNLCDKELETEERCLLIAGSSSGLAAAFNAPLAGIVFAFEELTKSFSHVVLVCTMISCSSALLIAELLAGQATVFSFSTVLTLPISLYIWLIPLALLCGVCAALFNATLCASLRIHDTIPVAFFRPLPACLIAFAAFLWFPSLLGNGHHVLESAAQGQYTIAILLMLLCGKFFYTALCYGSGAPGGIFFPMLVLGALIGACYCTVLAYFIPSMHSFVTLFIILGMTAFFSGVTLAPITGCILISEMTGSLSHLIPLIVVSLISYGIAQYCGSEPIYDVLLARMKKQKKTAHNI